VASRHLSLRIDESVLNRLDAESRKSRQTRSELAKLLIEEGLRMQAHPGIVFRPTATGRRQAALADGPKVWVVAEVYREIDGDHAARVKQTSELTELSEYQVQVAVGYYADYRDEIDDWLRQNNEEAEQAYAAWLRQQEMPVVETAPR